MSNQVEIGFWEVNIETGAISISKGLNDFLEFRESKSISFSEFLNHIPNQSDRFRIMRNIKKSITQNRSFSEIINFSTFDSRTPIQISIVGKPIIIGNFNPKMTGVALKYNSSIFLESPVKKSSREIDNIEHPNLDRNLKKLCKLTIKQKVVLAEVRYYISHNIMNHVANLLGLYDIYSNLNSECEKKEFVDYMGFSISKLNNELRMIYERIEEVDQC